MKLNLSVEGKLLASVSLESFNENNEYYLKAFRRMLIIRHQQQLSQAKKQPCFHVEPSEDKSRSFVH